MPRGAAKGERRGGRQKGVPNKTSLAKEAAIAATGYTPKDALLRKMRFHLVAADKEEARGASADAAKVSAALDKASEAATQLAPYVHPRLQAIEHTGAEGRAIQTEATVTHKLDPASAKIIADLVK